MLKKILGEAPFDVFLKEQIVFSPKKKHPAVFDFSNDTEYDLPLSCRLNTGSFADTDKMNFDITVPANGNTRMTLTFSLKDDTKLFLGSKICELEIVDRIFDSKTVYEFEIKSEMAFKCPNDGFLPGSDVLFSRNGVIYANKGEKVLLEVACFQEKKILLKVLSGEVKGVNEEESISLSEGVNKLFFEMQKDGAFEFELAESGERIHLDTINPKYFI